MFYEIFGLTESQFIGFFLSFIRIAALMSVAPILGSQSIPVQVKVFLSLFLSVTMLPALKEQPQLETITLLGLLPLIFKEIVLGLFLGYNAKFIFESYQFAGRMVSTQMGLGMANLVDPDSGQPVTPIGNIYTFFIMMVFLFLNGHHLLISALYKSFEISPAASYKFALAGARWEMVSLFNEIFIIGIKLAAPSMATLFLIEVCMGIMARIVPQMNIFFIGLPVRLGVGLFIVIASLPMYYLFFSNHLLEWKYDLFTIVKFF